MKTTFLALNLLIVLFTAPLAEAGHIGGALGTSMFIDSSGNSSKLTGTVDAAFGVNPAIELGAFYLKTTYSYITIFGGELNFYPMVMHNIVFSGKVGSSDIAGSNHIAYGVSAGYNHDIVPLLVSLGVEVSYFATGYRSINQVPILGTVRAWF